MDLQSVMGMFLIMFSYNTLAHFRATVMALIRKCIVVSTDAEPLVGGEYGVARV